MNKKLFKKLEEKAGYNLANGFLAAKQTAARLFSLKIGREKKIGKILGTDVYLSLKLNDFFDVNVRYGMPYINKIYEILNHNSIVVKFKKAGEIASGYVYLMHYNSTETIVGFNVGIPVNWDVIEVVASEYFGCNYKANNIYRAENVIFSTMDIVFYATQRFIINPVFNRIEEGFCLKCGEPHFRIGLNGLCRPCGGIYTYER